MSPCQNKCPDHQETTVFNLSPIQVSSYGFSSVIIHELGNLPIKATARKKFKITLPTLSKSTNISYQEETIWSHLKTIQTTGNKSRGNIGSLTLQRNAVRRHYQLELERAGLKFMSLGSHWKFQILLLSLLSLEQKKSRVWNQFLKDYSS